MDYHTKPTLISKQQAINIAMNGTSCTSDLRLLGPSASLFHIKNDAVFSVNDTNMQDWYVTSHHLADTIKSTNYVWEIDWSCFNNNYSIEEKQYTRFVDAKSGVLLY